MTSVTDSAPRWADGADIHDEGTVDEYRCWWSLSVPVDGVRTYEHMEEMTAKVLIEQTHTAGQSPFHRGPFVVVEIDTDSANRALLTPAVARRLALQLLHHAEILTEEAPR